MLLTDRTELKAVLEINPNDTSEDANLNYFIEWASRLIREFCNRDFELKYRTEFYNGTNTQRICLRERPVFPAVGTANVLTVTVDEAGLYGSAPNAFTNNPLTYGVDYCLQIDQPDGSSRSGILIRYNNIWPMPQVRQAGLLSPFFVQDTGSVKVQYYAGYTPDTLPGEIRAACNFLAARLRYLFPLTMELTGESYEGRSISIGADTRNYLFSLIAPMLGTSYRNWSGTFG